MLLHYYSSSESHYNRLDLESATVELNELFVQEVSFSHDPRGMSKGHSCLTKPNKGQLENVQSKEKVIAT